MPLEDETARFLKSWMQLRQLVQAANFNRFQRAGLSATQFMALNVIPAEGTTLSALAKTLNLSAASLSETVNSLQERGLVQRNRNGQDARKIDIQVTAEGGEMQNAASQEFHRFMAGIFSAMAPTRRQGLLAGLEELVKLGDAASAAPSSSTRHVDAALPEAHSAAPPRRP